MEPIQGPFVKFGQKVASLIALYNHYAPIFVSQHFLPTALIKEAFFYHSSKQN